MMMMVKKKKKASPLVDGAEAALAQLLPVA
jgi:hypothetical protein